MATTRSAGDAATSVESGSGPGSAGFRKLSTASGGGIAGGAAPSWQSCYYCTREQFKTISDFVK